MNLLKTLKGNGWKIQQAVLTTYPFDPQFFSEYVRPRLNKRKCSLPLVLLDSRTYERELTSPEWRAAPIGTDFLLEPVYAEGVFHPKLNVFASDRSVFVSVSSANLMREEYCQAAQLGGTVGIQRNWIDDPEYDLVDELAVAAEARDVLARFLAMDGFITGHDAREYIEQTLETLDWLETAATEVNDEDRNVWLFSNVSTPILEQVRDQIGEVETAQLYAPFYGTPAVINQVAATLGADRVELFVESESTALDVEELPETIDRPFDIRRLEHNTARWVHAKFLTVDGEWGSGCLYGSPNMTSTALLEPATRGNVEVGLFRTYSESSKPTAADAMPQDDSFPVSVSEPIDDLSTLSLRARSYEGWESVERRDEQLLRLLDARITQPDDDGVAELLITVDGLDDEADLIVKTQRGHERRITVEESETSEIGIDIDEVDYPKWRDAVLTVGIAERGLSSNPRRIGTETQQYLREGRDIIRSNGTQQSTALLSKILRSGDSAAIDVFDLALSDLQSRRSSVASNVETASKAGASQQESGAQEQYPERTAERLRGSSSSSPSVSKLVHRHLSYHREQGLEVLDVADIPGPSIVDSFIEHIETFWETVELCLLIERIEGVDVTDAVQSACAEETQELFDEFETIVSRVNAIVARAESDSTVEQQFVGESDEGFYELDQWKEVFDVLFVHPAFLVELSQQSESPVIESSKQLANRLRRVLDRVDPIIRQYLYDGPYLCNRSKELVEETRALTNWSTVEGDEEFPVDARGLQALVLYTLVQKIADDAEFLDGLQNHLQYSDTAVRTLLEFALAGEDAVIEYELAAGVQWRIALADPVSRVKATLDELQS